MNKRGSVFVNVLVITSILMMIGMLGLRLVLVDVKYARSDKDRALALQLAEGGLDYGIELILNTDSVVLEGVYQVAANLTVGIQSTGVNRYLIASTGTVGNSTRQVQMEVFHRPVFGHSLFVGSREAPLELKNVLFEGPVQICAQTVTFGPGVTFQSGVHFEHYEDELTIYSSSVPPYTLGIGAEVTYGLSEVSPPDIDITLLEELGENTVQTSPTGLLTVNWNDLLAYNYYDVATLEIDWGGTVTAPPGEEGLIVIINTGSVGFIGNSLIPETLGISLIVIAGGDIYGVTSEDQLQSINVPLYLYAEGSIYINNGMKNIRSVIALDSFILGSGKEDWEFHRFDPIVIPGLEEAWGSFITIDKWSN